MLTLTLDGWPDDRIFADSHACLVPEAACRDAHRTIAAGDFRSTLGASFHIRVLSAEIWLARAHKHVLGFIPLHLGQIQSRRPDTRRWTEILFKLPPVSSACSNGELTYVDHANCTTRCERLNHSLRTIVGRSLTSYGYLQNRFAVYVNLRQLTVEPTQTLVRACMGPRSQIPRFKIKQFNA